MAAKHWNVWVKELLMVNKPEKSPVKDKILQDIKELSSQTYCLCIYCLFLYRARALP